MGEEGGVERDRRGEQRASTIINACSVTVSSNIATVITIKEQFVFFHTVCVFGTIIMTE